MASKIKSLKALDFVKTISKRNNIINDAPATPVKKTSDYLANSLAAALHPECQYLKVAKVIEEQDGVKTFVLVPNTAKGTSKLAFFSAGQYLSITLEIGNAKLTRPYSIASAPSASLKGEYRLTIKRVDGGLATNYILDNWAVGTEIKTSGPEGVFTYEPLRDAKHVIGLAGGSGITPFLSLAHAIADGDEDATLTLLYGSRKQSDILFKDEFDEIAKSCDKVKVVYVLSDEKTEGFENGFLTADLIKKYAGEGDYSLFICGPQGMYNFLDGEIKKLGIRGKFVRHEVFGEFHNPQKQADYPQITAETCNITVNRQGIKQVVKASVNDTILCSIEKAGIIAPSRCRSGICGYCHSKLVSGDVYVPQSVDGRRLADLKYGYIHPCCTFPLGDIEIVIK